jgi:hypothetical protein
MRFADTTLIDLGAGGTPVDLEFAYTPSAQAKLVLIAPSAAGTSSRAEGPNTAEPAATTACPAPKVNREPTVGSAPIASTP